MRTKSTASIYELFKTLTDGEEFDSNDAALQVMQVGYDTLLAQREWWFLEKSDELQLSDLSLPEDFWRVKKVWYRDSAGNVSEVPLVRGEKRDRFNSDYDYYIDELEGKLVLINEITTGSLIIDYTHKPAELEEISDEEEPVMPEEYRPLIAFYMKQQYKSADENPDFYKETGVDFNSLEQRMIDEDARHQEIYG